MNNIAQSDINMKSCIESKTLSSIKTKENKDINLLKSTFLISNNLIDFNKRYEYCLEKELNNNLSRSTHFGDNYHISINNQIINGNINLNKNIMIEEENNSIEMLELIYKNKIKFYEKIKELILPKKIDIKEIKYDEEEYIIEKIKKLIFENKKINKKKDNIIAFDKKKLIFSHCQNLLIKSNINSDIYEKGLDLFKESTNNNFKKKQEIIMKNKNIINNTDDNTMDDIKMLKENINNLDNFLPEIISPKNIYKIFMHCIRQFDYEKKLYIKFLNKEDLIMLNNFAKKFNKFIDRVFSTLLNNEKNSSS